VEAQEHVAPLSDLCDRDPFDLESDPRLSVAGPGEPCGPLCTPWCLASHGGVSSGAGASDRSAALGDRCAPDAR